MKLHLNSAREENKTNQKVQKFKTEPKRSTKGSVSQEEKEREREEQRG